MREPPAMARLAAANVSDRHRGTSKALRLSSCYAAPQGFKAVIRDADAGARDVASKAPQTRVFEHVSKETRGPT